jgi:isoamylase
LGREEEKVRTESVSTRHVRPGDSYPLGATWDGGGTNFSLFSEIAQKVELCLFDESGAEQRIAMPDVTGFCWHGYLPGIGPGQRYGSACTDRGLPRRGTGPMRRRC